MTLETVDSTALLPSAITTDEEARALLSVLDANWREMSAALPMLALLATLDSQSGEVVDRLAYQLHVDYYRTDMPLATRRTLVRNAIPFHRLAGTRGAVEDAIAAIWGTGAKITEWFEMTPPLEPGRFLIILSGALAEGDLESFLASLRAVKRATDWPVIMTSGGTTNIDISIAAGAAMLITQSYGTFEV